MIPQRCSAESRLIDRRLSQRLDVRRYSWTNSDRRLLLHRRQRYSDGRDCRYYRRCKFSTHSGLSELTRLLVEHRYSCRRRHLGLSRSRRFRKHRHGWNRRRRSRRDLCRPRCPTILRVDSRRLALRQQRPLRYRPLPRLIELSS